MILTILISIHIVFGSVAITAGFVAFLSTKGQLVHRTAGKIFLIAMLVNSASCFILGFIAPVMLSTIGGLLVFYLVLTSWVTVRSGETPQSLSIALFVLVLIVIGSGFYYGLEAMNNENGLKDGFPASLYFVYGAIVGGIAATGDLVVLVRGNVGNVYRIMRHLWRMGFAMYVATASFFLGQPKMFPESIRGTLVLAAPVLLVLVLTLLGFASVMLKNRKYTRKCV